MPDEDQPGTGEETETETTETTPETGTDWEAEARKWKSLSRKHEDSAKTNAEAARKLKEQEDAQKTREEQAADRAADAEKRATTAERASLRLEVALDKAPEGMSIAQVRKLAKRLAGDSKEDLETDAEELFADFQPAEEEEPDTGSRRRPREKLKPGAAPSAEAEENDPAKLADLIPPMY